MALFKLQSLISITLDTGIDCSAASVMKILYERPDGTRSFWNASWVGVNDPTKITYSLLVGDAIPQAGKWRFQSFVNIGGRDGFGDIFEHDFKNNLL